MLEQKLKLQKNYLFFLIKMSFVDSFLMKKLSQTG